MEIKVKLDDPVAKNLEAIIKNELGSFVEGYLAKKKLLGKRPPDMIELIDSRIKLLIQRTVKEHMYDIEDIVAETIRTQVEQTVHAQLQKQAAMARNALLAAALNGA